MRERSLLLVALMLIPGADVLGAADSEAKPVRLRQEAALVEPFPAPEGSRSLRVQAFGADPWVIEHDGLLYFTQSTGAEIKIWSASSIGRLSAAQPVVVWRPDGSVPGASHNIWAPEIHRLKGRWYIYFAADDGKNENHRMFVLESAAGPLGPYHLKGRLSASDADSWAIDGTPFEYQGQLYFIWSGWPGKSDGLQNLYIAHMDTPWSLGGKRTLISSPQYQWESWINEGPQVLIQGRQIYVAYSANRSWTDEYRIGMLRLDGTNPLDPGSWTKAERPVFDSVASGVEPIYAPGHCSFYFDRRTGEDWILYHVARGKGAGWDREVRAQRFRFNAGSAPDFGRPLPLHGAVEEADRLD